jgi:hypothetical protein
MLEQAKEAGAEESLYTFIMFGFRTGYLLSDEP